MLLLTVHSYRVLAYVSLRDFGHGKAGVRLCARSCLHIGGDNDDLSLLLDFTIDSMSFIFVLTLDFSPPVVLEIFWR